MHLFYGNIEEKVAFLHENEAHHACKVLRLSIGDNLMVTNGNGTCCEGVITSISRKECIIQIKNQFTKGKKSNLHIAIAPTKSNDRFEFFLEKATEIGIGTITPLLTKNSERKKINPTRFEKILVSAMKQSQNFYLPKLNELTTFKDFITHISEENLLIAHCEDESNKQTIQQLKNASTLILIGPEGDFNSNEIQMAKSAGFKPITLGETRLRTETAGIVATTLYNIS